MDKADLEQFKQALEEMKADFSKIQETLMDKDDLKQFKQAVEEMKADGTFDGDIEIITDEEYREEIAAQWRDDHYADIMNRRKRPYLYLITSNGMRVENEQ